MQHCTEISNTGWVEYVTALGTAAAAIIALAVAARAARRESQSKPKLTLHYDHASTDDLATDIGTAGPSQHWVRMRVSNSPGRRSAEEAEVLIVKVLTPADKGGWRSLQGFALHWANTKGGTTQMTIAPGVTRHIDLAALQQPINQAGVRVVSGDTTARRIPLRLAVRPKPADNSHELPFGTYTLHLVLTARDTDATYYEVDIRFDGIWWSADQIRSKLFVGNPSKMKPPKQH